ncbi:MAG: hypothetical protein ACK5HY_11285 [Parahaliea sp.]
MLESSDVRAFVPMARILLQRECVRMSTGRESGYRTEWVLLQNQYDSYEKLSLLIKLSNIVITTLLLFVWHAGFWVVAVTAILWLQDGIWKTWQSRINTRLLEVEAALDDTASGAGGPLQYNQRWRVTRPGVAGLAKAYLRNAMAPTVAYPHVVLVALGVLVVI